LVGGQFGAAERGQTQRVELFNGLIQRADTDSQGS
jgi:hypothetical protein